LATVRRSAASFSADARVSAAVTFLALSYGILPIDDQDAVLYSVGQVAEMLGV